MHQEYADYSKSNKKNHKIDNIGFSINGYVLGLVGSITGFILSFLILVIGLLINIFSNEIIEMMYSIEPLFYFLEFFSSDFLFSDIMFHISTYTHMILAFINFFVITIFLGFTVGLFSSLKSRNDKTYISSIFMILGGIISLICLIIPGLFLITGGILNLRYLKKTKIVNKDILVLQSGEKVLELNQ